MAFVPREPTRKVHITRILGTNKAGDVLPDIWVDVERFDQYLVNTQATANQFQQIIRKFRWHDDPDDPMEYRPEDDDTARLTVVLKVCAPDEADLNDPEQWVPVRVIKRVHLQGGDDPGSAINNRFITAILTAERKVKNRRTSHHDTSIDAKAEAAFNADPARKAFVVKSADYEMDDKTKDDSQYVECELVTAITKQASAHAQSNGTEQQVILQFKNKYLIEETDEAKLEELGNEDKNPPYRLDPFQNIVNVQFAAGSIFVIGDSDGFIWSVRIKSKTDAQTKVMEQVGRVAPPGGLQIDDERPGGFQGGAYALLGEGDSKTPTFLLAGYRWADSPTPGLPFQFWGRILISHDGIDWTVAWEYTDDDQSSKVPSYMTWDDETKKFYVMVSCRSKHEPVGDQVSTNECWSSPDGIDWTVIQSGITDGEIPSAFTDHCQFIWEDHPSPTLNGSGIPYGKFGLDPGLESSTEEPPVGNIIAGEGHRIITTDFPTTIAQVTFVEGSMWGRAGNNDISGALEVSFDHGKTWIEVAGGEAAHFSLFNGFIGAPTKDIKAT